MFIKNETLLFLSYDQCLSPQLGAETTLRGSGDEPVQALHSWLGFFCIVANLQITIKLLIVKYEMGIFS